MPHRRLCRSILNDCVAPFCGVFTEGYCYRSQKVIVTGAGDSLGAGIGPQPQVAGGSSPGGLSAPGGRSGFRQRGAEGDAIAGSNWPARAAHREEMGRLRLPGRAAPPGHRSLQFVSARGRACAPRERVSLPAGKKRAGYCAAAVRHTVVERVFDVILRPTGIDAASRMQFLM